MPVSDAQYKHKQIRALYVHTITFRSCASQPLLVNKNIMSNNFPLIIQDFITQEYQVSVKEVLDNALQGREAANFEFPLYTKDRQRVEVLLNATTRRDVCGAVVGMIGVGQDITERKQVEVEKTRVAQELQTFIDTANAPIFGIDANGLVNEWNNKSAAITGFSREEVLGKNLVQVSI